MQLSASDPSTMHDQCTALVCYHPEYRSGCTAGRDEPTGPSSRMPRSIISLETVRERRHPIRDVLIVANLLATFVVLAVLVVLLWLAVDGAVYPLDQLPTHDAPVMPHPGGTQ